MKITDATMLLSSQRTYSEVNEERTDFRFWVDPQRTPNADRVSLSQAARSCAQCESKGRDELLDQDMELEISLERLITELLSGKKVKVVRMDDVSRSPEAEVPAKKAAPDEPEQTSEGWGLDYFHETLYQEKEAVSFETRGIIRTADGKEVGFSLRLDMSREYVERNSIRIRAGDALKDPLIINFDGTAAQLTDRTFGFDIDSDGNDEALPILAGGKGYLAIDLDGDGMITNGSELFGPSTGNGFQELSAYDSDGNSWIDENDDAFSRLSVLSFDAEGNQVLRGIRERGVGAIYTQYSSTQFDLKDQASGDLRGRVRSSGVYLTESGGAGTIQQVDLKV